jgi:hypothetical protein
VSCRDLITLFLFNYEENKGGLSSWPDELWDKVVQSGLSATVILAMDTIALSIYKGEMKL